MASIRKRPGGVWRARYRDADGREHARHFERKVDAQTWLDGVTASLVRGDYVDPQAGKVRFDVFAEQWLAAQTTDVSTREQTARRLRLHILPTFGDLELRAIRPSTVQAWLRGRSEQFAASSVRVMYVNVSAILSAAVDDGLIARNPCQAKSVRPPRIDATRPVPWTAEQVASVVAELRPRWRAIVVVAAGCGVRQGEVFGLHVQDVDFLGRKLQVRHQVKRLNSGFVLAAPKGGKTREIPLPDVVAVALSEHLRAFPPGPDGLIFRTTRGGLMDRSAFTHQVWKPALRRAGIDPTRSNGMHILRHTYASVLLDAGENIRALAAYLGHAYPGFTLRVYAHLMPASEDRTRRAIDGAYASHADQLRTQMA